MERIRVKIFSDICEPSCNLGALQSWGKGISYENIDFVSDNDFSHAIVINMATPNFSIPRKNVINLLWEPYEMLNLNLITNFVNKKGSCLIAHDKKLIGNGIKCWIPFLPPLPLQHNFIKPKKHKMSIIASSKTAFIGHKLRHQIIERILKSDLDIHIYGRGIVDNFKNKDSRIKGFVEDKTMALSEYDYTIAIENTKYDYYLTEKYTDPIVCGCIPLYWGANEVNTVYGDESHINLPNTNDPDCVFDYIKEVYKNNYTKDTSIVLDRINKKINLPHFIWEHFSLK